MNELTCTHCNRILRISEQKKSNIELLDKYAKMIKLIEGWVINNGEPYCNRCKRLNEMNKMGVGK